WLACLTSWYPSCCSLLTHTRRSQYHKNTTSVRSCHAKMPVRPASRLHCATKRSLCTSCCTTDAMDAGEGVACGFEVSGCLTNKERQERMRKDDLRTGVIYMRDKGTCGK